MSCLFTMYPSWGGGGDSSPGQIPLGGGGGGDTSPGQTFTQNWYQVEEHKGSWGVRNQLVTFILTSHLFK